MRVSPVGWLLVATGALFVALLVTLRRYRRRVRPSSPQDRVQVSVAGRAPVKPVSAEELGPMPEPIRACPQCGSAGIRALTMAEGGVPGASELLDRQRCPRCGYEGLAVVFDTRDDYASFLRRLDLSWRAAQQRKG